MWLYFNEKYDCTTAIYHGQVIRQGNSFDLYLCFPYKSTNTSLNPICQFVLKGQSSITAGIPQVNEKWGSQVTFERVETGEYIGDFKVGEKYCCYHIYVPAYQGVTENYGNIPFTVHVKKDGAEIIGTKSLYVQKTYGNSNVTTISVSEYNNLIALISQYSTMAKFSLLFNDLIEDIYGLGITIYVYQRLAFVGGMFTVENDFTDSGFIEIARNNDISLNIHYGAFIHGIIVESTDQSRVGTDVELRLDRDGNGVFMSISSAVVKKGDTIAITGMAMAEAVDEDSLIGDTSLLEIHNLNTLDTTGKYICNDSSEPTGFPTNLMTYNSGYLYEVFRYVSNGIVYVRQIITTTNGKQAFRLVAKSDMVSDGSDWVLTTN